MLITIISTAIVSVALFALAQSSPWGGRGHVSVSSTGVRIKFKVTDSRGTGTADFHCEVINPNGVVHTAHTGLPEWRDGRAEAVFTYPDDFGGSDVPCTTRTPGTYKIMCYWYIDGYGVNGKTAAGTGEFTVE
jgi:hypothetical protein